MITIHDDGRTRKKKQLANKKKRKKKHHNQRVQPDTKVIVRTAKKFGQRGAYCYVPKK